MQIWWFRDGRAGHERQARALLDALGRLRPVHVREAGPLRPAALLRAATGRLWPDEPAPDLLLGAGRRTHVSLLAARRARGGRSVVLMRPGLPAAWFDLCIVPRHDRVKTSPRVLETLGPLSPVRPADRRDGPPMVLVGGPSRHYRWDDGAVLSAIRDALAPRPGERWLVATSRRTPPSFESRAAAELPPGAELHPAGQTPPGWLDEHLPLARSCLVTPDSLSMIFDCLTAGVPCGVFELPVARAGRVTGAVATLLHEGRVGRAGGELPPGASLDEADRVARRIVERWFP